MGVAAGRVGLIRALSTHAVWGGLLWCEEQQI